MAVKRGDKLSRNITANDWNAMLALVSQEKGRAADKLAEVLRTIYSPSVCWVQNTTSSPRAAFEVMSLDNIIADVRVYEGEKYKPIHFTGTTITNNPLYSYCVLQEPAAPNGGFARAVVAGVTLCKLNITHASDMWADVVDSVNTTLKTHCVGSSRVILKNSGTGSGDKWGILRIGDRSGEVLVFNDTGSTISSGGSGVASVASGTPLSETLTGQEILAYNRTGFDWGDQKFGTLALLGGRGPYVSPLESP
jgi:hypothetical protein